MFTTFTHMTPNRNQKKCPMCGGTGKVGGERSLSPVLREAHVKEAIRLRADGCSLRQIAAYLGYKHPQSVQHLLDSAKKTTTKK